VQVGWKEIVTLQVPPVHPEHSFERQIPRHLVHAGAEKENFHRIPHLGISVLYACHHIADIGRDSKLFPQFAFECLLRRFAGAHLSAGKLPPMCEYRVGQPLANQDSAVLLNNGRHYP
jgi:hypothetical protein